MTQRYETIPYRPLRPERAAAAGGLARRDSRAARPTGSLQQEQVTEERIAQVRRLNEIAAARGPGVAQLALAWVLRQPGSPPRCSGASRADQLDADVGVHAALFKGPYVCVHGVCLEPKRRMYPYAAERVYARRKLANVHGWRTTATKRCRREH